MVVVVHQGGYERHDDGAMIVAAMDYMPDGVENVAGCADVGFVDWKLEVAYLTVESRWHLSLGEGHGEVGEEGKAEDAEVIGKADGVDDSPRADIDQRACGDVPLLQVEVDARFSIHDDAEAMVVDGERRLLAYQQTKHGVVSVNHAQFTVKEDVLANL